MRGSSKVDHPFLRLELSASDDAGFDHLDAALTEIANCDRSVGIKKRPHQRLFILEGRAKADLQSICDRIRNEYHLAVNVGLLDVAFLETIRKQAEGEGKYIRQTGGMGNYGHCRLRIQPSEFGKGYEFTNEMRDGSIPSDYVKAVEEGVVTAMGLGVLAGFPVVDVKVTLYDGSYHEADSNQMAFKFAGADAFKEAAQRASPVVLEPMMAVEIEVPEQLVAATQNEIRTHRGRIESNVTANALSKMKAVVPLSELLLSTSGIAMCPMQFAGYEAVQDNDSSGENLSGVTANRPGGPRSHSRSEAAQPDSED